MAIVALLVALLLVLLIVLEGFLFFWIPYLRKDFQWLITARDENPEVPAEALKKFLGDGFDPELGWSRKPNTSAKESGGTLGERGMGYKKSSYAIDGHGARVNPGHENYPKNISTYGDSFVFCRQVNDVETFQWYLSEKTRSNVLNFGVGNYGFDQALLRFKREFPKNRTPIVVIGVVPETITRIMSVWKHYYEYGNVLGFKPKYSLAGDRLVLAPNPVSDAQIYSKLSTVIPQVQEADIFYQRKFRRDMLSFPYLFSIFKNAARNIPLVCALSLLKSRFLKRVMGERLDRKPWSIILQQNALFVRQLYKDRESVELFLALIDEYVLLAKNFGCKPVLLLMPYLADVRYAREHGSFYADFVQKAKDKILVIDLMDRLLSDPAVETYFSSDFYGGHMSAAGNQWCSEVLFEVLSDMRMLDSTDMNQKPEENA